MPAVRRNVKVRAELIAVDLVVHVVEQRPDLKALCVRPLDVGGVRHGDDLSLRPA